MRWAGWGIFGVELFVKGDEVWFSEVRPAPRYRPGDLVSQYQSEFALHARAILGLPVDRDGSPGASAVIMAGSKRGRCFSKGWRKRLGYREAIAPVRQTGIFVKRRMGVALARAATTDEARARAAPNGGGPGVRPRPAKS